MRRALCALQQQLKLCNLCGQPIYKGSPSAWNAFSTSGMLREDERDEIVAGIIESLEDSESEIEAEEKPPRGRRLTRKQKGSWRDSPELQEEIFENAPIWPENVPVYDPQSQMPWLFDTASPLLEMMKRLREEDPRGFHAMLSRQIPEEEGPWPGANKILEWEVHAVFSASLRTGETHPLNKKVKCRVYLRDLQQEFGLSNQAVQYIAMLSGPRYNPNKGLLTLTSEKFRQREDNRLHVIQMLTNLIAEGKRVHPKKDSSSKDNMQEMAA